MGLEAFFHILMADAPAHHHLLLSFKPRRLWNPKIVSFLFSPFHDLIPDTSELLSQRRWWLWREREEPVKQNLLSHHTSVHPHHNLNPFSLLTTYFINIQSSSLSSSLTSFSWSLAISSHYQYFHDHHERNTSCLIWHLMLFPFCFLSFLTFLSFGTLSSDFRYSLVSSPFLISSPIIIMIMTLGSHDISTQLLDVHRGWNGIFVHRAYSTAHYGNFIARWSSIHPPSPIFPKHSLIIMHDDDTLSETDALSSWLWWLSGACITLHDEQQWNKRKRGLGGKPHSHLIFMRNDEHLLLSFCFWWMMLSSSYSLVYCDVHLLSFPWFDFMLFLLLFSFLIQ